MADAAAFASHGFQNSAFQVGAVDATESTSWDHRNFMRKRKGKAERKLEADLKRVHETLPKQQAALSEAMQRAAIQAQHAAQIRYWEDLAANAASPLESFLAEWQADEARAAAGVPTSFELEAQQKQREAAKRDAEREKQLAAQRAVEAAEHAAQDERLIAFIRLMDEPDDDTFAQFQARRQAEARAAEAAKQAARDAEEEARRIEQGEMAMRLFEMFADDMDDDYPPRRKH